MKKLLCKDRTNERGNATVITVGILLATMMMIVLLATIFSIYINKRQMQTAADAASLGAVKTLSERYKQELIQQRKQSLQHFWAEVEQQMTRQTNNLTLTPPESKKMREQIIDDLIGLEQLRTELKSNRTPSVKLLHNESRYQYFAQQFSSERLGDILYQTASQNRQAILKSAGEMAVKNGAEKKVQGVFPADQQPKIMFTVQKPIRLLIFDDLMAQANKYISISAAARIQSNDLPPIEIKQKKQIKF